MVLEKVEHQGFVVVESVWTSTNTHSLPQSPVDLMWLSCSTNSEPVTLSIKYVLVPKALSRYWISMTNPSFTIRSLSVECLSADNLTNLGVFPIW